MKKLIFIQLMLMIFFSSGYGQVITRYFPDKSALEQSLIRNHQKSAKVIRMPSFDIQKMIEEDKLNESLDIPFRFGKGFDTNITLNEGEWTEVDNGRLWSMEFQSGQAYSINFVFEDFYLPDGAELYIANSKGTMLYGPVTAKHNTKNGYFLTDLVQGDNVTIYLFEPVHRKEQTRLLITKVVHAYKNLFSSMAYGNLGGSEDCNNNIACFHDWDLESDAVAMVLLSDGTEWCSGSLLMTADQSFRPYFLSAFHCIDTSNNRVLSETEISNAENWMFKFQYKMTSCRGNNATVGVTYNGAEFRAAWDNTDFALMEMDRSPVGDERFAWLGWDRTGNTPISGTGIHHPSGDVMKISFDENQFQRSNWNGTNNHWLLNFDNGVVEHSSSGSPIFDQNKRVVGQLHGNQWYNPRLDYCAQPRAEYGRFDLSWSGGGANTTRLSNWLDPTGIGAVTVNTTRSPVVSGSSTLLGQAKYTLTNLSDGATVQWSAGNNNLTLLSQQGNWAVFRGDFYGESSIQATVNINGTIVTLNPFPVMVDIDLSPLNSAYITGPSFVCGNSASFNFVNLTSASSVKWDYGTYTTGDEPYTVNISSYSGSPGVAKVTAEITYKGKAQDVQHEYKFNFNHPGTHYVDDSIIMNHGIYYDSYRGILTISFSYLYPASGSNYEWSCSNSNLQLVSGGTDYAEFEGPPVTGYVSINMCFNNPCGERTCLVREVYLSDDLYRNYAPFTIFPNPATDFVTVKLQENRIENNSISLQQSVQSSKTPRYEIQLWSSSSMLRSYKTDQMTFQLPVSGLPEGLYFVRVIKDGKAYTKKLLVR